MLIETGARDPLLCIPTTTPIFANSLYLFETEARQKYSSHLILEIYHGVAGCTAKSNHCIYLTGKQLTVVKALNKFSRSTSEDTVNYIDPTRP